MISTRVFRPPIRGSKVPFVLTLVLDVVIVVGVVLLGLVAFGSSQPSYTVAAGTLVVDSGSLLDGKRTVALASIVDSRVLTVSRPQRVRGTGAPGLCTGVWSYAETGEVWQATDCSPRVVSIRATSEPRAILVSPPDADAFVEQLRSGTDGSIVLPPGDRTLLRTVPAIAAVALVFAAVMLTLLFVRGPRRMRYLVGDGTLTIETIFSRRSFAARELRARLYAPRMGLRLAGTAFPGYFTGLFREGGVTTRVYATDVRSQGVLLEGAARVFLSPAQPAEFLRALEQEGASIAR